MGLFGFLKRNKNKVSNEQDAYSFIADIVYYSGDEFDALKMFPKEARSLFVAMDIYYEVANGGFVQAYMVNSTKYYYTLCFDAFNEIGIAEMSKVCKDAQEFLRSSDITFKFEYDMDEFRELYETIDFTEYENKLMSYDDVFYEKIENYYEDNKDIINNFIKENHT